MRSLLVNYHQIWNVFHRLTVGMCGLQLMATFLGGCGIWGQGLLEDIWRGPVLRFSGMQYAAGWAPSVSRSPSHHVFYAMWTGLLNQEPKQVSLYFGQSNRTTRLWPNSLVITYVGKKNMLLPDMTFNILKFIFWDTSNFSLEWRCNYVLSTWKENNKNKQTDNPNRKSNRQEWDY